jgi:O-antigen ligase
MFFFLGFFSLFFLLIFLGETSFYPILLGFFSIFLLFFSKFLDHRESTRYPLLFLFFTAFSIIGLFLLNFSFHLSLALSRIVFFIFSFQVASFFALRDKKWLEDEILGQGFVLSGIILAVFSVILNFLPNITEKLPKINLLVATYGHNHAASYFIFVLPLAWYIWKEKKWKKASLFPLLVIVLALVISFARWALLIGLIELIFLSFFDFQKIPIHKSILQSKLAIFLLITILTALSFLTIFSFSTQKKDCFFPQLSSQICKPLEKEPRPIYWKQAFKAIELKPWTGWGGNNFTVVSVLFRENTWDFSAFPHNEYIQILVEYGILGFLAYIVFILGVVNSSFFQIRNHKSLQDKLLFYFSISTLAMLTDAVLDYNLNYLSLWIAFLIGVVIIWHQPPKVLNFINPVKLSKSLNITLRSIIFLWFGLFVLGKILWQIKEYDLSLIIFPYESTVVSQAIQKKIITSSTQKKLLEFYHTDTHLLRESGFLSTDDLEKQLIFKQIIFLDKFDAHASYELLKVYENKQDWENFYNELTRWRAQFVAEKQWNLSPAERNDIVTWSIEGANSTVFTNSELSLGLYRLAYSIHPWMLNEVYSDLFSETKAFPEKKVNDLIDSFDLNYLLIYQGDLKSFYYRRMDSAIEQQDYTNTLFSLERILTISPLEGNKIWNTFSPKLHEQFDTALRSHKLSVAENILSTWSSIQRSTIPNQEKIDLNLSDQYASQLRTDMKNLEEANLNQ